MCPDDLANGTILYWWLQGGVNAVGPNLMFPRIVLALTPLIRAERGKALSGLQKIWVGLTKTVTKKMIHDFMSHDFMTQDFWLISHDSLLMLIVAVAPDHGNNSWWEWVVGPESVEKSWKSWQLAENRNFSFFSVLGRFSTFSTFFNWFRSAYSFPPTIVLTTLHYDH